MTGRVSDEMLEAAVREFQAAFDLALGARMLVALEAAMRRADEPAVRREVSEVEDRPRVEAVERLAALLSEVYQPAGALMYVSAPHRLLDGRTVASAIHSGNLDDLERVSDQLDALADGSFL